MLNLHPQIEQSLIEMEQRRTKLLALSPHLSRVERIVHDTLEGHASIFHYSDRICVSWSLTKYTDSIPLLTALAKEGWKRDGKMEKGTETFQWNLTYEARPGLEIRLELEGRPPLDDDTAVCRRVQVGSRTIEVPEYEIQCDEPTEAKAVLN